MNRRRAFVLIVTLLLSLVLLTAGMAMLTKRGLAYKTAFHADLAAQAEGLAWAGLEDARVKLDKDLDFPPVRSPSVHDSYPPDMISAQSSDYRQFSYTEPVTDGVNPVGSYTVTVDMRLKGDPWRVVRLTSVGTVGDLANPAARRKLYAELDVSEELRTGAGPNPDFFEFVQIVDLGGL